MSDPTRQMPSNETTQKEVDISGSCYSLNQPNPPFLSFPRWFGAAQIHQLHVGVCNVNRGLGRRFFARVFSSNAVLFSIVYAQICWLELNLLKCLQPSTILFTFFYTILALLSHFSVLSPALASGLLTRFLPAEKKVNHPEFFPFFVRVYLTWL